MPLVNETSSDNNSGNASDNNGDETFMANKKPQSDVYKDVTRYSWEYTYKYP
jgi:hypothetical protein